MPCNSSSDQLMPLAGEIVEASPGGAYQRCHYSAAPVSGASAEGERMMFTSSAIRNCALHVGSAQNTEHVKQFIDRVFWGWGLATPELAGLLSFLGAALDSGHLFFLRLLGG